MATTLQDWIGRREVLHEPLSPGQAARMAALLDRTMAPMPGSDLPPLWHWLYFTPRDVQSQIGLDGHPQLGGFLPPVPLPRRMWAGGRLRFHAPLLTGEGATRETEIAALSEKVGKAGSLIFLTLRHRFSGANGLAIEEEQDIVYKGASATARPGAGEGDLAVADWREGVTPDPVLLFRYSALTFNAHRIHYDLPYATGVEDYPALVVHGPLTATLLLDAAIRQTGRQPSGFSFRGQAPLFADAPFALCGRCDAEGANLWAEGPGGYTAMSARVTFAGGTSDAD